MERKRPTQQGILEQDTALSAYLDAMLQPTLIPLAEPMTDDVAAVTEPASPDISTAATAPRSVEAGFDQALPEWGRQAFSCLQFSVAGLMLAIPLINLRGVVPLLGKSLSPMPGHSAEFLGVVEHQNQQVRVVDMALFVLPESRRAAYAAGEASAFSHMVLIDDGRWGLACEAVGEVVTLEPEQVKWRGREGRRPWLAGTAIQQMCAVLSAENLARLLEKGVCAS